MNWLSEESEILHHPAKPLLKEELELCRLLPGHVWVHTSGTTSGKKKWIALSKSALLTSARAVNEHLDASPADRWLQALPGFHVGGLGIQARAFLLEQEVIRLENWSPQAFCQLVEETQATLSALVPTQIFDLVERGLRAPRSLRAVVVGGGALSPLLYKKARELNWSLLPSFGMTEVCSQVATATLDSLQRHDFPRLQILSHVLVRCDQEQRLEIASAALLTGTAEWDKTSWILSDPKVGGWWKSEDRVELFDDFTLVPLGRVQDQVKILGELVDLSALESRLQNLLFTQQLPLEATLVASLHLRRGQNLDLVVAPLVGAKLEDARSLINIFNLNLLPHERCQNLYWVARLPRTDLKKVARVQLRKQLGFEDAANVIGDGTL